MSAPSKTLLTCVYITPTQTHIHTDREVFPVLSVFRFVRVEETQILLYKRVFVQVLRSGKH